MTLNALTHDLYLLSFIVSRELAARIIIICNIARTCVNNFSTRSRIFIMILQNIFFEPSGRVSFISTNSSLIYNSSFTRNAPYFIWTRAKCVHADKTNICETCHHHLMKKKSFSLRSEIFKLLQSLKKKKLLKEIYDFFFQTGIKAHIIIVSLYVMFIYRMCVRQSCCINLPAMHAEACRTLCVLWRNKL